MEEVECVKKIRNRSKYENCYPSCSGLTVSSYSKTHTNLSLGKMSLAPSDVAAYDEYTTMNSSTLFPPKLKGCINLNYFQSINLNIAVQWTNRLRFIRIYFETPTFDRITKDRAAKFVDMLSAIGGTMGLLTGFSIISGVEILYFAVKIIIQFSERNK